MQEKKHSSFDHSRTQIKKSRIGIFGMVPIALLQEKSISLSEIRAYAALSSFQGSNESSWPSLVEISTRAGLHPDNVSKAIKRLKLRGWVEVRRRGLGKSNVYCVLSDLAESAKSDLAESAKSLEKNKRKEQEKRTTNPRLSPPRRGSKQAQGGLHGEFYMKKEKKEKKRSPEFTDLWNQWTEVIKDKKIPLLSADYIKASVHLEKLLKEFDYQQVRDIMDNLYWRVFFPWKYNKREQFMKSRGYSFQTAYYCREELNFSDLTSEWQDRIKAHGEVIFTEASRG